MDPKTTKNRSQLRKNLRNKTTQKDWRKFGGNWLEIVSIANISLRVSPRWKRLDSEFEGYEILYEKGLDTKSREIDRSKVTQA